MVNELVEILDSFFFGRNTDVPAFNVHVFTSDF